MHSSKRRKADDTSQSTVLSSDAIIRLFLDALPPALVRDILLDLKRSCGHDVGDVKPRTDWSMASWFTYPCQLRYEEYRTTLSRLLRTKSSNSVVGDRTLAVVRSRVVVAITEKLKYVPYSAEVAEAQKKTYTLWTDRPRLRSTDRAQPVSATAFRTLFDRVAAPSVTEDDEIQVKPSRRLTIDRVIDLLLHRIRFGVLPSRATWVLGIDAPSVASKRRDEERRYLRDTKLELHHPIELFGGEILLPVDVFLHIMTYLPHNLDLISTLGVVSEQFFSGVLLSWRNVRVHCRNVRSVSLVVMQSVHEVLVGCPFDLTHRSSTFGKSEWRYLLQNVTLRRLTMLNLVDLGAHFKSVSAFVSAIRQEGFDLPNLRKLSFPDLRFVWDKRKLSTMARWAKTFYEARENLPAFPKLRSVEHVSGVFAPVLHNSPQVSEAHVVVREFAGTAHFAQILSFRRYPFPWHTLRALALEVVWCPRYTDIPSPPISTYAESAFHDHVLKSTSLLSLRLRLHLIGIGKEDNTVAVTTIPPSVESVSLRSPFSGPNPILCFDEGGPVLNSFSADSLIFYSPPEYISRFLPASLGSRVQELRLSGEVLAKLTARGHWHHVLQKLFEGYDPTRSTLTKVVLEIKTAEDRRIRFTWSVGDADQPLLVEIAGLSEGWVPHSDAAALRYDRGIDLETFLLPYQYLMTSTEQKKFLRWGKDVIPMKLVLYESIVSALAKLGIARSEMKKRPSCVMVKPNTSRFPMWLLDVSADVHVELRA